METAMQDMIQELGCENCRQKRMCNGIDLMNCYTKKRLTIKSSKPSLNSQKNQSAKPKVTIIDNNPLSIASYMEDHPDVEL